LDRISSVEKEKDCDMLKANDTESREYLIFGPKVSGLTYKSRAKWKMLRGIYSDIYGEVNLSVCVEIKGDYIVK
jgi:hypothetical protein